MWENPLESSRSALRPTTMPLSLTFLPDVQFEHQQLVLTGVSNKVAADVCSVTLLDCTVVSGMLSDCIHLPFLFSDL